MRRSPPGFIFKRHVMPVKILSLVWYKVLPPKFGGQKGIALFNQYLSRHSELVCLCSNDNQPPGNLSYKTLPVLPRGQKQVINPLYWLKVRRIVSAESPSLLILEHPYHGLTARFALAGKKTKLFIHAHNIESERFRQIGKWWWKILHYYERWTFRNASMVIFKTESDRNFAIQCFNINRENCLILPYGIERPWLPADARTTIRQQYGVAPSEKLLLFAGTLDYEPNAKAVGDIYAELAPRLRAAGLRFKILICGRNKFPKFNYLHKLNDPDVIMAGEQEIITPYFAAADVFVNTVTAGGGIQTKVLDAIAHQCNTVCFAQMAEGIPPEICGPKLLTAPDNDWDTFSAHTLQASNSNDSTPAAFFDHFDWNRLLQPLIRKLRVHD